jgi:hypothetical protein
MFYGREPCLSVQRKNILMSVFVSGGLRKIFEPKREVRRGEWRKSHNEELHDLYTSPNTVWPKSELNVISY